jgi:hypothetical protein
MAICSVRVGVRGEKFRARSRAGGDLVELELELGRIQQLRTRRGGMAENCLLGAPGGHVGRAMLEGSRQAAETRAISARV